MNYSTVRSTYNTPTIDDTCFHEKRKMQELEKQWENCLQHSVYHSPMCQFSDTNSYWTILEWDTPWGVDNMCTSETIRTKSHKNWRLIIIEYKRLKRKQKIWNSKRPSLVCARWVHTMCSCTRIWIKYKFNSASQSDNKWIMKLVKWKARDRETEREFRLDCVKSK